MHGIGMGQRRGSLAARKGADFVRADIDWSRGFEQARVTHY
jgi:hypothetical protein